MVDTFLAKSFVGRADSGRSEPLLCLVAREHETREVFLKVPGLHADLTSGTLVCEWMAARLARDLGLPCPEPVQVELRYDFIESVEDQTLRQLLVSSGGVAFGSTNLGSQWHLWARGSSLPRTMLPLATSIYVFDTLVENWDRTIDNPNLLKKGDDLAIVDHEEAFSLARNPIAERGGVRWPWQVGGIQNHYQGTAQHVLWEKLRPKADVDFAEALQPWRGLSDGLFMQYADEVPQCWDVVSARRVEEFLSLARQNLDSFETQLQQTLDGA